MTLRIRSDATDAEVFAKVARSTAGAMWGTPVQRQRVVIRGKAWSFETPGHGGDVIALTPAEFAAFPLGSWRDGSQIYNLIRGHHVVAFEEDCDWALPVIFLPGFSQALAAKEGKQRAELLLEAWDTVNRWEDGGRYYGKVAV